MSHPVELLSAAGPIRAAVLFLVAWWLKGASILALGWLAARLLARRSAAARHLAWTLAVAAALCVSLVSPLVPALGVPLPGSLLASDRAVAVQDLAAGPAGVVRAASPATETVLPAGVGLPAPEASRGEAAAPVASGSLVRGVDRFGVVLALWLSGVLFLLLRSAGGRLARRRIVHESAPAPADWLDVAGRRPREPPGPPTRAPPGQHRGSGAHDLGRGAARGRAARRRTDLDLAAPA